jgi:hypothetical protein
MTRRFDRDAGIGLGVVAVAAVLYWLADRGFEAGRGDFFYLADAFLHGRTWLIGPLGPFDVIDIDGRIYVPFAPFPAVALMPLVALVGPVTADQWESSVNALLAAAGVGMCWWLIGRIGVVRRWDRLWLTVLLGFSTQILWVTTRGGVWHTGHLVATILTFACLIELWGRRRAVLIGLLAGAAFLTRAPLAFAIPFYALFLLWPPASAVGAVAVRADTARSRLAVIPWRSWLWLAIGVLPAIVGFFAYNQLRFGTPFESGYALASLPPFLEVNRAAGLFSLVHVPMNLDYLFVHLPIPIPEPPFFQPDGLGMSILLTSPGLLFAIRADWRGRTAWLLLGTAVAVLVPTLLYYGGGWLQFGYRYFLDSVPFVIALCGLAAVRRGRVRWGWRILIAVGVVVNAIGVYWAYRLQ